jgi:hypothetical protein
MPQGVQTARRETETLGDPGEGRSDVAEMKMSSQLIGEVSMPRANTSFNIIHPRRCLYAAT